ESLSTLHFATRASKVVNKSIINRVLSEADAMIKLKAENAALKKRVAELESGAASTPSTPSTVEGEGTVSVVKQPSVRRSSIGVVRPGAGSGSGVPRPPCSGIPGPSRVGGSRIGGGLPSGMKRPPRVSAVGAPSTKRTVATAPKGSEGETEKTDTQKEGEGEGEAPEFSDSDSEGEGERDTVPGGGDTICIVGDVPMGETEAEREREKDTEAEREREMQGLVATIEDLQTEIVISRTKLKEATTYNLGI
ncbi:hypothetical protein KIPB_012013, partial [Kipferlia bialata]